MINGFAFIILFYFFHPTDVCLLGFKRILLIGGSVSDNVLEKHTVGALRVVGEDGKHNFSDVLVEIFDEDFGSAGMF